MSGGGGGLVRETGPLVELRRRWHHLMGRLRAHR